MYDKFCGAAYQAHNLSDGEHNLSYIEGYALDDVGSSDIAPAALIFEQTWSSLIQKPADHEGATNVLPVNDDNTGMSGVSVLLKSRLTDYRSIHGLAGRQRCRLQQ